MKTNSDGLSSLSEEALYELLGEAWLEQQVLKIKPGVVYFVGTPAEIGKREFDSIVSELQKSLSQPGQDDIVSVAARTIKKSCNWMPAQIVATLAVKRNLAALVDTSAIRQVSDDERKLPIH